MRRSFIAGNWKMNLTRAECVALANALVDADLTGNVDIAVCPPAVYLDAVAGCLKGSAIGVGAQNLYFRSNGAFTGETSAAMLLDIGCKYVIIGHSERRHVLGETDAEINEKTLVAIANGLTPIVCVGETLEQREAGDTARVVQQQFDAAFAGVSAEAAAKSVVAYEPVWAIGTGKVATPDQAQQVHADLRTLIENRYNSEVASKLVIQYGGSVKPDNAAELLSCPDIDGALVGGASLQADSFAGIIAGAAQ